MSDQKARGLPELRSPGHGTGDRLSATDGRHGLDLDDGGARLPGLVILTDATVEHYWSSIRRKVR